VKVNYGSDLVHRPQGERYNPQYMSTCKRIIQLLNKERVQGTTVATPIQTAETRWEVDKDREVMTQRGTKNRAEGNINLRKKEVLSLKGQAVVTANRYAALEADSRLL